VRSSDTVRDVRPSDSVRDLMEKAMRGESVASSRLESELARMLSLVAKTDEDFERVVVLVRPEGLGALASFEMRGRVLDVVSLPDGSALVQTTFSMSAKDFAATQIAPLMLDDDLGGLPCFAASHLEVAAAASSFDDVLYLLGEALEIL
jgi:hypothetical protein